MVCFPGDCGAKRIQSRRPTRVLGGKRRQPHPPENSPSFSAFQHSAVQLLGVFNQFPGTSRGSFWSVASCGCSLKPRWKTPLGISFPDLREHYWKGPSATGCEKEQIQSLKVTVYGITIPVRRSWIGGFSSSPLPFSLGGSQSEDEVSRD